MGMRYKSLIKVGAISSALLLSLYFTKDDTTKNLDTKVKHENVVSLDNQVEDLDTKVKHENVVSLDSQVEDLDKKVDNENIVSLDDKVEVKEDKVKEYHLKHGMNVIIGKYERLEPIDDRSYGLYFTYDDQEYVLKIEDEEFYQRIKGIEKYILRYGKVVKLEIPMYDKDDMSDSVISFGQGTRSEYYREKRLKKEAEKYVKHKEVEIF